ncbi:MAG: diacylglycerol kinase family protein [Pirellulales bacterium]
MKYFAVVNRAAGGGRCGKLADSALEKLHRGGIDVELAESRHPGHGSELARDAYQRGFRRFIAFGGDGTSYEIINGLFPLAHGDSGALGMDPVTLAFQPLGTGNSFLRDFTDRGADHTIEALLSGRTRPCDVLRLTYKCESQQAGTQQTRTLHYINMLSMGYSADVAALTNRRLKGWGPIGYLLSIFICLFQLRCPSLPSRTTEQKEFDRRQHLFLAFCNSKFTGGRMLVAPQAETDSGLVEMVRCGPMGRMELLRNLRGLYDGSYINLPIVSRSAVPTIEFDLESPVDLVVDGEVLHLHCLRIDVLPAALQVVV